MITILKNKFLNTKLQRFSCDFYWNYLKKNKMIHLIVVARPHNMNKTYNKIIKTSIKCFHFIELTEFKMNISIFTSTE